MRHQSKAFFALALALLLGGAAEATAQHAGHGDHTTFAGKWTLDTQASDDIDKVVDANIGKVKSALLRPFAKGRLRKTNAPYPSVMITPGSENTTIVFGSRPPIVSPASGQLVPWTRPEDGEKMQISTAWKANALEQTFKAEDGTRVNTYSLSPDGQVLTMNVSVASGKLSSPITYRLVYRRAS